jgi:two-component system OmpR family sensor kinase
VSLRARLLAGLVTSLAVALAAVAVATYAEQRSFLYSRLDQQVLAASAPVSLQLGLAGPRGLRRERRGAPRGGRDPFQASGFLPSGTVGELLSPAGRVLRGPVTFSYGQAQAAPALPARLPITSAGGRPRPFTTGALKRSALRYRVIALTDPGRAGTLVVAVPLRDIDQTLSRLLTVEGLVGAGVILAMLLVGLAVIRLGLRPLERIGRVANEIASGDLSRRVSPAEPRTEVGRLGLSLNEMLVHIEQAFTDRQASEERLRRFLADASHELRTPLASIRGYAELFRLGAAADPDDLERAMARIEAEATRMGVLVEDLLLLARLDELPPARRERIDLVELAEHAVQDAGAIAPERGIRLQTAGAVSVDGDPHQLRQVLDNLLRNALRHTPDGSTVDVSVRRERAEVVLEVRDHGPGLPADAGERVFERFWRAEAGRTRGPGGAGLGLAIVQAITHAHGGGVRADNAPDGGARLSVALPAPAARAAGGDKRAALLS